MNIRYVFLRVSQQARAIRGFMFHLQALRHQDQRQRDPRYIGSTEESVDDMMSMVRENVIIQLWYGEDIDTLNNQKG